MKKRTLNQTWVLCLRLYKWVAKMKAKGSRKQVCVLKNQWFYENLLDVKIESNCFFCDFCKFCDGCPGKLVDSDFNCENEDYSYNDKPIAFYKELLRLNRIRKAHP